MNPVIASFVASTVERSEKFPIQQRAGVEWVLEQLDEWASNVELKAGNSAEAVDFWPPKKLAGHLRIGYRTVLDWISSGLVTGYRMRAGGALRVDRNEVIAVLHQRAEARGKGQRPGAQITAREEKAAAI